jgi:predicted protein tyrosine phosphatase
MKELHPDDPRLKIKMNRLANTKNQHQGIHKKVLCVCSAGLLRSPTLAWVLSNPPWNCNTRACGAEPEYALIPLDLALVEWADEIVCAEQEHVDAAKAFVKHCSDADKRIFNLDLPDYHSTRSTSLVHLINERLDAVKFEGTVPTDLSSTKRRDLSSSSIV